MGWERSAGNRPAEGSQMSDGVHADPTTHSSVARNQDRGFRKDRFKATRPIQPVNSFDGVSAVESLFRDTSNLSRTQWISGPNRSVRAGRGGTEALSNWQSDPGTDAGPDRSSPSRGLPLHFPRLCEIMTFAMLSRRAHELRVVQLFSDGAGAVLEASARGRSSVETREFQT